MRFNSKIDIWLGVLIVAVAAMVLKTAYLIFLQPYGFFEAAMLVVLGAILPMWVLFSTNYHVIDENLWINSGPFRWKIPALSISRIGFSKSWKPSPALSLDRIVIEYDGDKLILVSPKEKTKFLAAIKSSITYGSRYQKIIKKL
jgi:hypothetical protein